MVFIHVIRERSSGLLQFPAGEAVKILLSVKILGTEGKKFPIMVDDAICHLSCYTSTHESTWHHYEEMAPQR